MKQFSLLLLGFLLAITSISQTITSNMTGDWNSTSTWVGGVVPTSANDVVIAAGHTVTTNGAAPTIAGLTVNATGILTMSPSNTLIVTGDVTNNGTINNGGNAGLRIAGSLTNQSTMTGATNSILIVAGPQLQNNGTIQFSFLYFSTTALGTNTIPVTVSGTGSFSVINLLIQKAGGATVTLSIPLTVGIINMGSGNGNLIIGSSDLQTGSVSSGNANKYIVTSGSGRLIITGSSATKTFPVGTATSYTPLTISGGNT